MDEIFGRLNFVANVLWQKRIGPDSRIPLGDAHDHILVYAVDRRAFQSTANRIPLTDKQVAEFKNPDNDPRGPWTSSSNFSAQGFRPNQMYKITTPGGSEYFPPEGRCWVTIEDEYQRLLREKRMWFGKNGRGMPRKKTYLNEQAGRASWTWWSNDDVGNTQESKKESIALFGASAAFDTPKPERLIQRIFQIATNPEDLVLDSFLGSGTTAAVAHKMQRRYIGIEMGDHAVTHCKPRLAEACAGEQGGISKSVGWQGGGGFRFCTLGEPLFDAYGNVSPSVNFPDLAAHVFFCETGSPIPRKAKESSPLIGTFKGRAIYLLHAAELTGVADAEAGNVLTAHTLENLPLPSPEFASSRIVYGEGCTVSEDRLASEGVTFKQIPYQIEGL